MHFSRCKNQNVLTGCSQFQHGHFWNDPGETHVLVLKPALTTKKVARAVIAGFVNGIMYPVRLRNDRTQKEATALLEKLNSEIEESGLPEEVPVPVSHIAKTPHLKVIK